MKQLKRALLSFSLLLSSTLLYAQAEISGTVVDPTGETVIGATVMEKGTSNGTVTDFDGGMTVTLQDDALALEEVVVTGYTTQRKADLTGAVSVVSVNELAKQNENNPMKALQGRVPGMNIQADGNLAGAATVRIRGIGTLNDNDGMHELNGNDIESIQVLKDAASASIYGSRAANGVIIITTKKGKDGKVKVNFDTSVAASFYAHKIETMNAQQWGRAFWQANVNDGINPNNNNLGYNFDWTYDKNGNQMEILC